MAREDYIPPQDDPFLAWHDNFKVQLLANAVTLGFVAGDTTPITADNTDIHTKVTTQTAAKAAYQSATNAKNISRVGAESRARAIAKRAKAHPAYTPAIGAALGIIGPDNSTNLNVSTPELKGRDLGNGHVELQFTKSTATGVNIYSKRGAESVFTFLAHDTQSPYIDTRPLLDPAKPELRTYHCKFTKVDDETGNVSEDLVVNCAP